VWCLWPLSREKAKGHRAKQPLYRPPKPGVAGSSPAGPVAKTPAQAGVLCCPARPQEIAQNRLSQGAGQRETNTSQNAEARLEFVTSGLQIRRRNAEPREDAASAGCL
jgi:hypothetical protein